MGYCCPCLYFLQKFPQSFAKLRQRPSQANVRSTTHLRGRISNPSAVSDRLDYIDGRVTVLNAGAVNQDNQHTPQRVGDDVALAALDFLACVIAANTPTFCGFDTLTVNHTGCRRGFLSLQFACRHNQATARASRLGRTFMSLVKLSIHLSSPR